MAEHGVLIIGAGHIGRAHVQAWQAHPGARVAAVIDAGEHYHELHGVEIEGDAVVVGPVPRAADADPETPELAGPERLMAVKYQHPGASMIHDGRHAWLRITPAKITSWDFRKLESLPPRP